MDILNRTFDEERALYGLKNSVVKNCRFAGPEDGESALKESSNIEVYDTLFDLRYPLWHITNAKISGCKLTENSRAALWYGKKVWIENCKMDGIKALRECDDIFLKDSTVKSQEFIWKCRNVSVENANIEQSEYPFFEVNGAKITNLKMMGKYSFQYCTDIEIADSDLNTKDAFWHSKNVTVCDCVIKSEYLGWYSENLTLINCRIIGTQPFCYCKNLVLENCTMENCDLAFERSTVRANINSKIESIKNPLAGRIEADCIGEIIIEESVEDPSKIQIVIRDCEECGNCKGRCDVHEYKE
ncbi:hypothetical protein MSI_21530 [Treponema sp. JC4]|uniref:DUF3737 family protein n=1 Tax=Treponema sp. JC4 TaxID=1124982 RepID=UPI00025B0E56|nr:DUF3737 family protein [Treponema sp. JC4]EID84368.1 hypothetical protein MSI_21530 [Treponema sp. JC4]